MLELENSREEIIVTFLVILELMKSQKIRITQDEAFGRIWIDLVTPGEETEPTEQDLMEQDPMESDPMGPEPLEQDSVEPELMEQDSVDTETMADPEPEPAVEPEPTAELKLDLIADPEPELIIEAEPEPVRRHLITRPRQHMTGPGRHAFPITAKRMRKDKFRLARGNRIWKRRKHLRLHLTSRKGT